MEERKGPRASHSPAWRVATSSLGETQSFLSRARGKDNMLKRILVTAVLGGALIFSGPAAMANPHGNGHDRDRHERHENSWRGGHDNYHRGGDRDDYHGHGYRDWDDRHGYRHHYYRYDYDDDYYYYNYNRPYYSRCYYRGGYRYYYDNGYSSRYCDDWYYRHGYRRGYYPYGYDTCDEYDYRTGYC